MTEIVYGQLLNEIKDIKISDGIAAYNMLVTRAVLFVGTCEDDKEALDVLKKLLNGIDVAVTIIGQKINDTLKPDSKTEIYTRLIPFQALATEVRGYILGLSLSPRLKQGES